MSPYLIAVLALLPAFALPLWAACRAGTGSRLVAVQLAAAVASLILVLMTYAFDQPSFIDLPLSLALLSLPGTLVLAIFLERWL